MGVERIGVLLPTMAARGDDLGDFVGAARHAEDLGFDSVWAVDQLVAGTGVPFVDSTVALAASAGATQRIGLAYGVMILPLRPVVWAAKQAASLQHVSGGRLTLGVGVGGDRHDLSWAASGVPRQERGRRTDAALAVLADLIAGKETDVGAPVTLAPGVPVPPIVVGGMAEAALRRTIAHGDGWFALPLPPASIAPSIDRLDELASEAGRARPDVIGSATVAIDGDATAPDRSELVRRLTDPDGMYGMPESAIDDILVTGPPAAIAERLQGWFDLGASRVVATLTAGSWHRQAELLAEAAALTR